MEMRRAPIKSNRFIWFSLGFFSVFVTRWRVVSTQVFPTVVTILIATWFVIFLRALLTASISARKTGNGEAY